MAAPDPTPTNALVNAVLARLEATLPALVASQRLPAITGYLNYDPSVQTIVARSPLIWCDIPELRRNNDPALGGTLNKYGQDRTALVGVAVATPSEQETCERLRAYTDLIQQAMEGNLTLDGKALWVRWQGTDLSVTMRDGSVNSLFKVAMLQFDMPRRILIPRA